MFPTYGLQLEIGRRYYSPLLIGPWLQQRFDFESRAVRRAFDCLSKLIKFTLCSLS